MKARHRRAAWVAASLLGLGLATTLVMLAFRDNLVFFFTPTQVQQGAAPQRQSFRIGGLVEAGSLHRSDDGLSVQFVVTDLVQRVPVHYRGPLPDVFKEGKGVVAQGRLLDDRSFAAEQVLAKHDENYMPPEAGRALEAASRAQKVSQR